MSKPVTEYTLNEKAVVLAALLEYFPWLGTGEEAESRSELICTLDDLFVSVGGKICVPDEDDVPIAASELWTETEMLAVIEAILNNHGTQSSSDWRGN